MVSKKNVLWVSLYAPYDKVSHAGGKIENYYIKQMHKIELFDVFIISFFHRYEKENLDLDRYEIKSSLIEIDKNFISKIGKKIINLESLINPFNRNAGFMLNYYEIMIKKEIKKYALKQIFPPDIIILEWTQIVLLGSFIKKLFPNSKIVAIEEDVAFLGYERKYTIEKNRLVKRIKKMKYLKLQKLELKSLNMVNAIVVNNNKDKKLLVKNGINQGKIYSMTPYFDNYYSVKYEGNSRDIIFFGAMARPENYLSAIWFIENVFSKIDKRGFRFIIIGSRPNEQLLKYQSDKINIVGFVEDVKPYFSKCLCLVAPLLLGAGIKIKILEALSAGLPVLTNDIGIEGIEANADKDYYHCLKPESYIDKIIQLSIDDSMRMEVSKNAKRFIENEYNLENDTMKFMNILSDL